MPHHCLQKTCSGGACFSLPVPRFFLPFRRQLMRRPRSGQASVEFALLYGAVILPLTFMLVFVSEMLWVWHSVVDFTRDGANYAATHCWMGDGSNVTTYMTTHVPRMVDM